MATQAELVATIGAVVVRAAGPNGRRFLDEFAAVNGFYRKHAIHSRTGQCGIHFRLSRSENSRDLLSPTNGYRTPAASGSTACEGGPVLQSSHDLRTPSMT
jgi:hypothetical protein